MNTEAQPTSTSTWPDRDRNEEGLPENARPRFGAPLPRGAKDELADRVEPEDVCSTVADTVEGGVERMAEERFFEAHEFFEWGWKGPATDDADRPFFKGMAQIVVGYTHAQRGNLKGSRTLLDRGVDAIEPFAPSCHGIDVTATVADAREFMLALAAGEEPAYPGPRLTPAAG